MALIGIVKWHSVYRGECLMTLQASARKPVIVGRSDGRAVRGPKRGRAGPKSVRETVSDYSDVRELVERHFTDARAKAVNQNSAMALKGFVTLMGR